MNASEVASVPMDISRVRVEPRLLSPLSSSPSTLASSGASFRLQIVGLVSRAEAEEKSREVGEVIGEVPQIVYDPEAKTWTLLTASGRPRLEAEELRGRLEDAGFDAAIVPLTPSARSSPPAGSPELAKSQGSQVQTRSSGANVINSVRPVARFSSPTREWWHLAQTQEGFLVPVRRLRLVPTTPMRRCVLMIDLIAGALKCLQIRGER